MKKITCLILTVLLMALFAVPGFAATRADVLDYLKEQIPDKYQSADYGYYILAENTLNQYDLEAGQWDQVLALVKGLREQIDADMGQSLHTYTETHQREVMAALNQFCQITGSTYTITDSSNPKHDGDWVVLLYNAEGTLVASLDGDLYPDRTGESASAVWLSVGIVLSLSALACAAWAVKRTKTRA